MKRILFLLTALLGLLVLPARALINPNFTPVHLVKQAGLIARVHFKLPIREGRTEAAVEVLKKEGAVGKTLTFDLSTAINKEDSESVQKAVASGAPCLFFVGKEKADAGGGAGAAGEVEDGFADQQGDVKAFLHVEGVWWVFFEGDGGVWELDHQDKHMQATWAGGTDMLEKCIRYILENSDADVPVATGAQWGGQERAARIAGKVHAAEAVELMPGRQFLHIAAEAGDLLLSSDDKGKFTDETRKRKLDAHSRAAAWADFNGDKRIDLLSWDGAAMTLHYQQADGTFEKQALADAEVAKAGCTALSVIDSGTAGKPGVIVSTPTSPLLWVPQDAERKAVVLSAGAVEVKKLGAAGTCLVADFDGDLLPDVIQMCEKGSLFYKATKPGAFAEAVACDAALGQGRSGAFVGDFDHDGLLDIVTVSEEPRGMWNNRGGGKFVQTIQYSGELVYVSQPRAIGGMTGDFNNDGRQDIFLFHSDRPPLLFFNRGYRSFGHSHALDLIEQRSLPAAKAGQQAGCLGDFNGDGGQDMALVLNNGEVWVFFRDTTNAPGLCVNVVLPVGSSFAGPLNVSGYAGDRALGAWRVVPGTSGAFLGKVNAGPCRITWQFPGGKKQEKEVVVMKGTVRFAISP